MSLLDRTPAPPDHDEAGSHVGPDDDQPPHHDDTVDLMETVRPAPSPVGQEQPVRDATAGAAATGAPRTEPELIARRARRDRTTVRGLRVRRIRLGSVAKIASVFFVLGYLATMATLVVVWNVALRLGFVETLENAIASSLGLDSYQVVGQALFDVLLVVAGTVALLGLIITLLLTVVYNASCAMFGGIALETGPLRRRRRVFSLRHRGFVSIR